MLDLDAITRTPSPSRYPERRGADADRFMRFIQPEPTTGCWLWLGAMNNEGYGNFTLDGRSVKAHRFAYEMFVGPIPDGQDIDHVRARGCATRACVNPEHLEPVSRRENILRGDGFAAQHARRTHCPSGHPLDGDNLFVGPNGTQLGRPRAARRCRTCMRDQGRERMRARRARTRCSTASP